MPKYLLGIYQLGYFFHNKKINFNRIFRVGFITALVFLASCRNNIKEELDELLPVIETYEGVFKNDQKPEIKYNMIFAENDWRRIWIKVNPNQHLPTIDFTTDFLLIGLTDAAKPESITPMVSRDKKGIISIGFFSGMREFQPTNETKITFFRFSKEKVNGFMWFDEKDKKMVEIRIPE